MKNLTILFFAAILFSVSSCSKNDGDCPSCANNNSYNNGNGYNGYTGYNNTTTTTNQTVVNSNSGNNTGTIDTTTTGTLTIGDTTVWMIQAAQLDPQGQTIHSVGASQIVFTGNCWKNTHVPATLHLTGTMSGQLNTYCYTNVCDAVAVQVSSINASGIATVSIVQQIHTYTDVCQ